MSIELKQSLTDPENQPNQFGVEFLLHGEKLAFKIGNQQFTLDYEPSDGGDFGFMREMLLIAFSTFTHDVKTARTTIQQPATGEPDVDFDLQELREIERAMDDFADCGETDVSDALLLRGVRAGFLECTHFHVANRGALQDAIDAAMLTAAPAQKGQP